MKFSYHCMEKKKISRKLTRIQNIFLKKIIKKYVWLNQVVIPRNKMTCNLRGNLLHVWLKTWSDSRHQSGRLDQSPGTTPPGACLCGSHTSAWASRPAPSSSAWAESAGCWAGVSDRCCPGWGSLETPGERAGLQRQRWGVCQTGLSRSG